MNFYLKLYHWAIEASYRDWQLLTFEPFQTPYFTTKKLVEYFFERPVLLSTLSQFLPNYTFFFQIHLHPRTAGCISDQNSNRSFKQFWCNLLFQLQVDGHVAPFPTGTCRILIGILENSHQNSGQENSWLYLKTHSIFVPFSHKMKLQILVQIILVKYQRY